MTCQQVHVNLSLYLYGELEFAREEELELHVGGCSLCQLALAREKSWHTALNAELQDVPLEFLSECRRDLRVALQSDLSKGVVRAGWSTRLTRLFDSFRLSSTRWSPRLAFASLFLFFGFTGARWADRFPFLDGHLFARTSQAGLTPEFSRIRAVQGGENNRIRIIVDQVQQQELVGNINDAAIRELLLQGIKDPADPGLRVDAVEVLKGHAGSDIRDALLFSVTHDENAAVRVKALEGLRQFHEDVVTREALLQVLGQDPSPAVRAQAINVLVPAGTAGPVLPDIADTLRSIIQSEPPDDYLHARCLQILNSGKRPGLY